MTRPHNCSIRQFKMNPDPFLTCPVQGRIKNKPPFHVPQSVQLHFLHIDLVLCWSVPSGLFIVWVRVLPYSSDWSGTRCVEHTAILLPQPQECWDYRCVPLSPATMLHCDCPEPCGPLLVSRAAECLLHGAGCPSTSLLNQC